MLKLSIKEGNSILFDTTMYNIFYSLQETKNQRILCMKNIKCQNKYLRLY